jgi:hypothetical protein
MSCQGLLFPIYRECTPQYNDISLSVKGLCSSKRPGRLGQQIAGPGYAPEDA